MKRQGDRQSGVSIVKAVLAVLVIGVIGTAVWFVYQHNRPQTTGATGGTQTTNSQQTTSTTPTPTTTYFTISAWGLRAPYSGSLKLSYTISADGRTASFSSDQLTALSNDCVGRGGTIVRWASTDQVSEGPATADTPTAASFFAGKDPATFPYAHIGNYYYTFAHAQAGCGDISSTAALQSQTNDAVKALVANLQAATN